MNRAPGSALQIPRRLRCAIYTRTSSEEGLDMEFNSLDAQREACEAYIASQRSEGWAAIREPYDDGGVSGGTLERPALQRLLVYHLINTPIDSAKLAGAKGPVNTVAGSGLVLDGSGQGLKANTANILAFDVKTTSGVLFVVDAVLTPEGAAAAMAEPAPDVPAETAPTAP